MAGKISRESIKKLLFVMVPVWIGFVICNLIWNNFWENYMSKDYSSFQVGITVALFIIAIIGMPVTAFVLYVKEIAGDLFGNGSYKYFAIPASKSGIILAKGIPVSVMLSISISLEVNFYKNLWVIDNLETDIFNYQMGDKRALSWIFDDLKFVISDYASVILIVLSICMLIILACSIGSMFSSGKKHTAGLIALGVELLIVVILRIINNMGSYLIVNSIAPESIRYDLDITDIESLIIYDGLSANLTIVNTLIAGLLIVLIAIVAIKIVSDNRIDIN